MSVLLVTHKKCVSFADSYNTRFDHSDNEGDDRLSSEPNEESPECDTPQSCNSDNGKVQNNKFQPLDYDGLESALDQFFASPKNKKSSGASNSEVTSQVSLTDKISPSQQLDYDGVNSVLDQFFGAEAARNNTVSRGPTQSSGQSRKSLSPEHLNPPQLPPKKVSKYSALIANLPLEIPEMSPRSDEQHAPDADKIKPKGLTHTKRAKIASRRRPGTNPNTKTKPAFQPLSGYTKASPSYYSNNNSSSSSSNNTNNTSNTATSNTAISSRYDQNSHRHNHISHHNNSRHNHNNSSRHNHNSSQSRSRVNRGGSPTNSNTNTANNNNNNSVNIDSTLRTVYSSPTINNSNNTSVSPHTPNTLSTHASQHHSSSSSTSTSNTTTGQSSTSANFFHRYYSPPAPPVPPNYTEQYGSETDTNTDNEDNEGHNLSGHIGALHEEEQDAWAVAALSSRTTPLRPLTGPNVENGAHIVITPPVPPRFTATRQHTSQSHQSHQPQPVQQTISKQGQQSYHVKPPSPNSCWGEGGLFSALPKSPMSQRSPQSARSQRSQRSSSPPRRPPPPRPTRAGDYQDDDDYLDMKHNDSCENSLNHTFNSTLNSTLDSSLNTTLNNTLDREVASSARRFTSPRSMVEPSSSDDSDDGDSFHHHYESKYDAPDAAVAEYRHKSAGVEETRAYWELARMFDTGSYEKSLPAGVVAEPLQQHKDKNLKQPDSPVGLMLEKKANFAHQRFRKDVDKAKSFTGVYKREKVIEVISDYRQEFKELGLKVFLCCVAHTFKTEGQKGIKAKTLKWIEYVDLDLNPTYFPQERYSPLPRPG